MNRLSLESEIKEIIITALNIEDIKPEDIDSNAPLFGEGLGLDSIDALELGMALKKKYNVTFKSEQKNNKKYFYSVKSLADYIVENTGIVFD